jgi:hypothetical protein
MTKLKRIYFGAQTDDLNQAKDWFEQLTGSKPVDYGHSDDLGGDYYRFTVSDTETVLILNNFLYYGEPVTPAPLEWTVVVEVQVAHESHAVVKALESHPEFERIRELDYFDFDIGAYPKPTA